jgi:hypothetical protein
LQSEFNDSLKWPSVLCPIQEQGIHVGLSLSNAATHYLCKRYFQDRATHRFSPQRGAVVRAGLITIAWPFLCGAGKKVGPNIGPR